MAKEPVTTSDDRRLFDSLLRFHRVQRSARSKRYLRFRLISLFLMVTICGLACGMIDFGVKIGRSWTPAHATQLVEGLRTTFQCAPDSPAIEVVILPVIVIDAAVGFSVLWLVYRLGEVRGFWLLSVLATLSFLFVVAGLRLGQQSIFQTEARELRFDQMTGFLLFSLAATITACAVLGWLGSTVKNRG